MPPKIRELIAELERNGFRNRGGKGSHRNLHHPFCSKVVRISGKTGDDAKKYQLKQVEEALGEVKGK
jgi:predicted RNA binding protein YcfA (HicA-like mRNA interferase family)